MTVYLALLYEGENMGKFIWGSVLTYKDLRNSTDYIFELFDTAIREMVNGEIKPRYYSAIFMNGNIRLYKYTDANRNKIKGMLDEHKLLSISLNISKQEYTGHNGNPTFNCITIGIVICEKQRRKELGWEKDFVNEVAFSVPTELRADKVSFLTEWIREIYIKVDGINGFIEYLPNIYLSGVTRSTPHMDIKKYIPDNDINYSEKVRGYFWLNIFSDRNLNIIGGIKYLEKNINFFKTERIITSNGSLAYICQLSEDIYEFNKNKYLNLKNKIKPLLIDEDIKKASIVKSSVSYFDEFRLVFNEMQLKQLEQLEKRPILEITKEMTEENELAEKRANKQKAKDKHKKVVWEKEVNIEYSCLNITIGFKEIDNQEEEILNRIFESWYDLGVFGGFNGVMHDAGGLTKIDNDFYMVVDFGSVDTENALTMLQNMINKFAEDENLEITKMTLGNNRGEF